MKPFFYSKPKSNVKIANVGDALKQLKAFNAMYEGGFAGAGASVDNCSDDKWRATWRKVVYEGTINTGGAPTELDFFERALGFSGKKTTEVEASELFIKYRTDKDYNIVAKTTVSANTPGGPVTFTLTRSMHSGNGKYSNVAIGGSIYNYDEQRMLQVVDVDTSIDFAHTVTVVPRSKDYQATIRGGAKMMFNPVRLVNGMSCSIPNSTWETPGYVQSVNPYRLRKDWETPLELDRPFTEQLQFAIMYDNNGNEIDSFEFKNTTSAREEFKYMKNIQFFMGEPTDNPLLLTGGVNVDAKYSGFMGYDPTLRYAGGTVYDVVAADGFDLNTDFQANMVFQDAKKKSGEYLVIHSFQWWLSMVNRSGETFMNNTGACTFESFTRSGAKKDDITKLGINSYHFANRTVHFKEVSAFSDERALGHGQFPYIAYMMPTMGIRTSTGRAVPPIEFFSLAGQYSSYEEEFRDHRKLESGCEKVSGTLSESIMMAVHDPQSHILLNPIL